MSAAKTLALGALILVVSASVARADGMGITIQWNSWNSQGNSVSSSSNDTAVFQPSASSGGVLTSTPVASDGSYSASYSPAMATYSNSGSSSSSNNSSSSGSTYDAFINMTNGGYTGSSTLVSGNPQPWYDSPVVSKVFGGTPTAQQQSAFTSEVLADVQRVYSNSNVPVTLTTDPNASAAHTVSVVSNASYGGNSQAIGITNVGGNGFDFIDKFTNFNTPDQLAQAVANNVSHELMHAFGIAVHHDQTGQYIDSGVATNALLTKPDATFSPAAVQDLLSRNFNDPNYNPLSGLQASGQSRVDGDQVIAPVPVPEPSTVALWTMAVVGFMGVRLRRVRLAA